MPRITASVDDAQYDHVDDVAEDLDVSLAEVLRRLIDAHRGGDVAGDALVQHDAPSDASGDVQQLRDRVDHLEERLDELEADEPTPTPDRTRAVVDVRSEPQDPWLDDVVAWVRAHQPVSRSEIVAAHQDVIDERGIKPDSWWRRHARPALEDAGLKYVRNVGWRDE